jgi:hypothetical protein
MAMPLKLTTPTDGEAIERGEVKSRRDGDSSASPGRRRAPGDALARDAPRGRSTRDADVELARRSARDVV